jgi:hypothetical protein
VSSAKGAALRPRGYVRPCRAANQRNQLGTLKCAPPSRRDARAVRGRAGPKPCGWDGVDFVRRAHPSAERSLLIVSSRHLVASPPTGVAHHEHVAGGRGLHAGAVGQEGRCRPAGLSVPALTAGPIASREERRDEEDEQSHKIWPTCDGCREAAHVISPVRWFYAQRYAVMRHTGSTGPPVANERTANRLA